jgi:hypothetical protein
MLLVASGMAQATDWAAFDATSAALVPAKVAANGKHHYDHNYCLFGGADMGFRFRRSPKIAPVSVPISQNLVSAIHFADEAQA